MLRSSRPTVVHGALVILVALATGCAGTPYGPAASVGSGGYGYLDRPLDEDTYWVKFKGNEFTSKVEVMDFVLLRAAEVAASRGHRFFVVRRPEDEGWTSVSYTPDWNFADPVGDSGGGFGTSGSVAHVGGGSTVTYYPGFSLEIRLVDDASSEDELFVVDAVEVARSIRAEYALPDSPELAAVATGPCSDESRP